MYAMVSQLFVYLIMFIHVHVFIISHCKEMKVYYVFLCDIALVVKLVRHVCL